MLVALGGCSRGPFCEEVASHLKSLPPAGGVTDDRPALSDLVDKCKADFSRELRLCYMSAHDLAQAKACETPKK